jgi:hypothetical protein
MKNLLLLILVSATLFSCQKESVEPQQPTPTNGNSGHTEISTPASLHYQFGGGQGYMAINNTLYNYELFECGQNLTTNWYHTYDVDVEYSITTTVSGNPVYEGIIMFTSGDSLIEVTGNTIGTATINYGFNCGGIVKEIMFKP